MEDEPNCRNSFEIPMSYLPHWAVFTDNTSDKSTFVNALLRGEFPDEFRQLRGKSAGLFSTTEVSRMIEEEYLHDNKILTATTSQDLQSMSSGERKKALLNYLMTIGNGYLIMDNPFDNLDTISRDALKKDLLKLSQEVSVVQLISRRSDVLPFIQYRYRLEGKNLKNIQDRKEEKALALPALHHKLPESPEYRPYDGKFLIRFKNVQVAYDSRQILKSITWDIRPGEFWELQGANGSGKTTLLTMITGDNPKAYGQEIWLFGRKKGSGESIWDIKKQIGYFTPAMIDRFSGYHSVEHMILSGLMDSIGLYVIPSAAQLRTTRAWLDLLGMESLAHTSFHDLTMGQQRMVMCARAMIKHPLLLILDEPTAGLDDESAQFFVSVVNKIAEDKKTTIIFVSHRKEPGLNPGFIFKLSSEQHGNRGAVV